MAKVQKGTVGIMGVGFVGGALLKYFRKQKMPTVIYDKYKKIGSIEQVNQAEIVFICVPTPFQNVKGFDLSFVKTAISYLSEPKLVVIKSTVIPGTTENLQKQYPKHKFFFNPEFLREASPYFDLVNSDRQILGYTKKSKKFSKYVFKFLPDSPHAINMPAAEAEMVKCMANSFLALKVVFANQFYDLCQKMKLNYSAIKDAVVKDQRIGNSHFEVSHGGYRGYGGSCFPKDVNAVRELAKSYRIDLSLLETMKKINKKLLKSSGLTEDYFLNDLHKQSFKGNRG